MTISIKSPTSTTGSIQKNGSDVLTFDSSDNVTVVNDLSVSGDITVSTDLSVSGNLTVTGNVPTPNTGPAFSAYKNGSNQGLTSAAFTKVTYDVEEFDTNSNFASSRFTPTVAGYYQINALTYVGASGALSRAITTIYKNGVFHKFGNDNLAFSSTEGRALASAIVYCNGTTDYIEIYILPLGTSPSANTGSANTYFQAHLVRAA